MNDSSKPTVVADDVVVSLEYTLTVDGEVVDSTEGIEPITFLQGYENIIPGLERELYGMKIGDSKQVKVPSKDAYGEIDPDAVVEVPRAEIPKDIPLKPGTELQVTNEDNELLDAVIVSVSKELVTLDFNHPLAGKDLTFAVKVVDLREAEPEELEHGHVHGDDFDEEDYDDDDIEYIEEDDLEEEEDNEEDTNLNGKAK